MKYIIILVYVICNLKFEPERIL